MSKHQTPTRTNDIHRSPSPWLPSFFFSPPKPPPPPPSLPIATLPDSTAEKNCIPLPHPSDLATDRSIDEEVIFSPPLLETFSDTITVWIHKPIRRPSRAHPWCAALLTHIPLAIGSQIRVGRYGRGVITTIIRLGDRHVTFKILETTRCKTLFLSTRLEWADPAYCRIKHYKNGFKVENSNWRTGKPLQT
ncbi:hypothetical protein BKA93DRAFT_748182 [Sparassis latifolia]